MVEPFSRCISSTLIPCYGALGDSLSKIGNKINAKGRYEIKTLFLFRILNDNEDSNAKPAHIGEVYKVTVAEPIRSSCRPGFSTSIRYLNSQ